MGAGAAPPFARNGLMDLCAVRCIPPDHLPRTKTPETMRKTGPQRPQPQPPSTTKDQTHPFAPPPPAGRGTEGEARVRQHGKAQTHLIEQPALPLTQPERGLEGALPALWRGACQDRLPHLLTLPRPVIPERERAAPGLDARL